MGDIFFEPSIFSEPEGTTPYNSSQYQELESGRIKYNSWKNEPCPQGSSGYYGEPITRHMFENYGGTSPCIPEPGYVGYVSIFNNAYQLFNKDYDTSDFPYVENEPYSHFHSLVKNTGSHPLLSDPINNLNRLPSCPNPDFFEVSTYPEPVSCDYIDANTESISGEVEITNCLLLSGEPCQSQYNFLDQNNYYNDDNLIISNILNENEINVAYLNSGNQQSSIQENIYSGSSYSVENCDDSPNTMLTQIGDGDLNFCKTEPGFLGSVIYTSPDTYSVSGPKSLNEINNIVTYGENQVRSIPCQDICKKELQIPGSFPFPNIYQEDILESEPDWCVNEGNEIISSNECKFEKGIYGGNIVADYSPLFYNNQGKMELITCPTGSSGTLNRTYLNDNNDFHGDFGGDDLYGSGCYIEPQYFGWIEAKDCEPYNQDHLDLDKLNACTENYEPTQPVTLHSEPEKYFPDNIKGRNNSANERYFFPCEPRVYFAEEEEITGFMFNISYDEPSDFETSYSDVTNCSQVLFDIDNDGSYRADCFNNSVFKNACTAGASEPDCAVRNIDSGEQKLPFLRCSEANLGYYINEPGIPEMCKEQNYCKLHSFKQPCVGEDGDLLACLEVGDTENYSLSDVGLVTFTGDSLNNSFCPNNFIHLPKNVKLPIDNAQQNQYNGTYYFSNTSDQGKYKYIIGSDKISSFEPTLTSDVTSDVTQAFEPMTMFEHYDDSGVDAYYESDLLSLQLALGPMNFKLPYFIEFDDTYKIFLVYLYPAPGQVPEKIMIEYNDVNDENDVNDNYKTIPQTFEVDGDDVKEHIIHLPITTNKVIIKNHSSNLLGAPIGTFVIHPNQESPDNLPVNDVVGTYDATDNSWIFACIASETNAIIVLKISEDQRHSSNPDTIAGSSRFIPDNDDDWNYYASGNPGSLNSGFDAVTLWGSSGEAGSEKIMTDVNWGINNIYINFVGYKVGEPTSNLDSFNEIHPINGTNISKNCQPILGRKGYLEINNGNQCILGDGTTCSTTEQLNEPSNYYIDMSEPVTCPTLSNGTNMCLDVPCYGPTIEYLSKEIDMVGNEGSVSMIPPSKITYPTPTDTTTTSGCEITRSLEGFGEYNITIDLSYCNLPLETLSSEVNVSAPIGTLKGGVGVNVSLEIPNVVGTYLFDQGAEEEDKWVFAHVGESGVIRAVVVEESQRPNTNPTVSNGFYINNDYINNTYDDFNDYVEIDDDENYTFANNFNAANMWMTPHSGTGYGEGQNLFILTDVNWNNEYIIESVSGYIELDFGEEITITEILMRGKYGVNKGVGLYRVKYEDDSGVFQDLERDTSQKDFERRNNSIYLRDNWEEEDLGDIDIDILLGNYNREIHFTGNSVSDYDINSAWTEKVQRLKQPTKTNKIRIYELMLFGGEDIITSYEASPPAAEVGYRVGVRGYKNLGESVNLGCEPEPNSNIEYIMPKYGESDNGVLMNNSLIIGAEPMDYTRLINTLGEELPHSSEIACKGGYGYNTDDESCLQCEPGHYSEYGELECTLCPPDQYQPEPEKDHCLLCPAGNVLNPSEPGSGEGSTSCTPVTCPSGSSTGNVPGTSGTWGLSGCLALPGYSGSVTATTCSVNGSVCNTGVQWSEPNNYYDDGLQAVSCPTGSTEDSGSSGVPDGCTAIPGWTGSITSTRVDPYYTETINQCETGTYKPLPGLTSCQTCGAGYETLDAEGDPTSTGATQCSVCPAGEYSALSTTECAPCVAGTYSDTDGSTQCSTCSDGYETLNAENLYTSTGATQCSLCPQDEYSNIETNWECLLCSDGYQATDDENSYVNIGGATHCSVCPAGQYSNSDTSGCITCPAGKYLDFSDQPNSSCTSCDPGTYSYEDGSTQCSTCSTGSVTNTLTGPGASSCTQCLPGHFSTSSTTACSHATCPSNSSIAPNPIAESGRSDTDGAYSPSVGVWDTNASTNNQGWIFAFKMNDGSWRLTKVSRYVSGQITDTFGHMSFPWIDENYMTDWYNSDPPDLTNGIIAAGTYWSDGSSQANNLNNAVISGGITAVGSIIDAWYDQGNSTAWAVVQTASTINNINWSPSETDFAELGSAVSWSTNNTIGCVPDAGYSGSVTPTTCLVDSSVCNSGVQWSEPENYYTSTLSPASCPSGSIGTVPVLPSGYTISGFECVDGSDEDKINSIDGTYIHGGTWNDKPYYTNLGGYQGGNIYLYFQNHTDGEQWVVSTELDYYWAHNYFSQETGNVATDYPGGNEPHDSNTYPVWRANCYGNPLGWADTGLITVIPYYGFSGSGCIAEPGYSGSVTPSQVDPYYTGEITQCAAGSYSDSAGQTSCEPCNNNIDENNQVFTWFSDLSILYPQGADSYVACSTPTNADYSITVTGAHSLCSGIVSKIDGDYVYAGMTITPGSGVTSRPRYVNLNIGDGLQGESIILAYNYYQNHWYFYSSVAAYPYVDGILANGVSPNQNYPGGNDAHNSAEGTLLLAFCTYQAQWAVTVDIQYLGYPGSHNYVASGEQPASVR